MAGATGTAIIASFRLTGARRALQHRRQV